MLIYRRCLAYLSLLPFKYKFSFMALKGTQSLGFTATSLLIWGTIRKLEFFAWLLLT